MNKLRKMSIFLAIAVITAVFSGCGQKQEAVVKQLTPVEALEVSKGEIQVTNALFGRIKALNEVAVFPKISGTVKDVYKNLGDRVQAGDSLFALDTEDLNRQLNQVDAQIKQSDAGVEIASTGVKQAEGSNAEQLLKQAEVNYSTAKTDYENSKALFASQAISKISLDASRDRFELAEIQLKNARESYRLSMQSANAQLKQAQSGKNVVETQKEILLQSIEDAVVKAPIKGVIAQKSVEAGVTVSPQSSAYTVVDMDQVVVETSATEKIVNLIAKGQDVIVKIKALEGKEFRGVIDALSPAATGTAGGYTVKVTIDNGNHEIKPGMFAEIEIITEKKSGIAAIPLEALLTEKDKKIVYILEGDTARKREVETGLKDSQRIEITGGLEMGEKIIIKGQQFVTDGEKVMPVGGNN